MPVILILAGPAGPAKSELLAGLAAALEARGRRTAVLDDAPAAPAAPAYPAYPAATLSGGRLGLTLPAEGLGLASLAARFFPEAEVLLSGALAGEKRAKVEYCPGGKPTLAGDPGLKALISPAGGEGPWPVFAPADLEGLADFLLAKVLPAPAPRLARVLVAGEGLPMKDFVQEIVARTIRALIGSLKGGDRPGRLEIFLE